MNKDDTKQVIMGFMEFMKGITGNQDLKIPEKIAKESDIEQSDISDNLTKEEAINNLEMIRVAFVESVTKEQRKLIDDTFDMAICALNEIDKTVEVLCTATRMQIALENELKAEKHNKKVMLKRIQAEIKELYSYVEFDEDIKTSFNMVRLEDVQRVIDKYEKESEDK